jgi:Kef-type K+ transport system membrane component KefB
MTHLSNSTTIGIMIFYSILTFFVGPYLTKPFFNNHPDQCVAGFLVGFTISVILWMKYGIHYVKKIK